MTSPVRWRPLFRNLIREAKALPDEVTRAFFKKKVRSSFRQRNLHLGDHQRLLGQLQAANAGYLHPVRRCLELAYGRRGKLARRRIEDILSEARQPEAEALLPGVDRTKPPNYTPRLQSYLTSPFSLTKGKSPTKDQLLRPPNLPERTASGSREASLLGPLNKRREANLRWRYLREITSRLAVPMTEKEADDLSRLIKQTSQLKRPLQTVRIVDTKGGRERRKAITARFMRRRYQELLDGAVIVTRTLKEDVAQAWVTRRPTAISEHTRRPRATQEDRRWLHRN